MFCFLMDFERPRHRDVAIARSRRLKATMNLPERRVWAALQGLHDNWRRPAPIGRFVVDFANHRRRLVIEVDGGVHRLADVAIRDAARDAWLAAQGYRVFRIDGQAVMRDLPSALRPALDT